MIQRLLIAAVLFVTVLAQAQERFEVGLGTGTTHALSGDAFESAASTGESRAAPILILCRWRPRYLSRWHR